MRGRYIIEKSKRAPGGVKEDYINPGGGGGGGAHIIVCVLKRDMSITKAKRDISRLTCSSNGAKVALSLPIYTIYVYEIPVDACTAVIMHDKSSPFATYSCAQQKFLIFFFFGFAREYYEKFHTCLCSKDQQKKIQKQNI